MSMRFSGLKIWSGSSFASSALSFSCRCSAQRTSALYVLNATVDTKAANNQKYA